MKKLAAFFLASMMIGSVAHAVDFSWSGDLRVRQETRYTQNGTPDVNNRNRIRLRYGFKADIQDNFQVFTRFATSKGQNLTNSVQGENNSTNQSFENFNDYPLFIDQAYVVYRPNVEWLERYKLFAGKMKNFFTTTYLVWDGDTNPDGLGHEYNFGAWVFRAAQWSRYSEKNAAGVTLRPEQATGIYAYQIGFMGDPFEIYLANYIDTNAANIGGGDYLDAIGTFALNPFKLSLNYSTERNTSKSGYVALLDFNKVKTAGDISARVGMFHYDDTFQPAYKDSDLAGANMEGYILGASYGLEDNIELAVNWLGKHTVTTQLDRTNLILDMIVKF